MEQMVAVFYHEFSQVLSFLEDQGFSKQQYEKDSLYILRYDKSNVLVVVTLIAKDDQIFLRIQVLMRLEEGEVRGADIQSLLTRKELENPELKRLQDAIDVLLQDENFIHRLGSQRDVESARTLFQMQAQWLAIALQHYMTEILSRLRWANRLA